MVIDVRYLSLGLSLNEKVDKYKYIRKKVYKFIILIFWIEDSINFLYRSGLDLIACESDSNFIKNY